MRDLRVLDDRASERDRLTVFAWTVLTTMVATVAGLLLMAASAPS